MTRRLTLMLTALIALLAAPAAAPAATTEGFAAVLEDGSVTRFTSQVPAAIAPPAVVRGLARGERVLALGRAGTRLLAVGSVGRLYVLDVAASRATPIGAPFPTGLRGLRVSLVPAPDGATAQVLTDVGQRLQVDTATGAVTELAPLRTTTGAATAPVAVALGDGRLAGVDPVAGTAVTEVAPGAGVVEARPLVLPRGTTLKEPLALARGTDGRVFLAAGAQDDRDGDGTPDDEGDVRQSRVGRVDLATGRVTLNFEGVLGREVVAMGSIGDVPADERVTGAQVRMARRVSIRRLTSTDRRIRLRALGLTVRAGEPVQVTLGLRVRGERVGFTFGNIDGPRGGTLSATSRFPLDLGRTRPFELRLLRRAVGTRASAIVGIRDRAGNRLVVNRRFTLVP